MPQGTASGEGAGARGPRARRIRSRLSGVFIAYAAVLLATGWAYASLRIRTDHDQTLELERNRLRTVAAALQTGIQAMLDDGVGAAANAANATAVAGSAESTVSERAQLLANILATRSDLRSLFLWSAGHYVRVGRNGAQETAATAPDWLWTPGSTASGTNWVGRPRRDPESPRQLVIPVARYFALPRGGVWAGAFFEFRAFNDLYARLGQNLSVMALVASDGSVLLRIPELKNPDLARGVNVGRSEVFRRALENPSAGVVEGTAPILNAPMLFGYERVRGYEMLITVGQSRELVLAPWYDRRAITIWVTGAYSALVILVTGLLSSHLAARKSAERTLEESEGRYRSLVDALPEAVFVHRGNDLLFVNRAGVRLIGAASAEQLAGRSVLSFAAQSERATLGARMRRILEQGQSTPPIEVRIHRLDAVPLWVEVQGVPIEFAGEPAVQSVLHDVTARHRQKEADDARAARIQQQSQALLRLASGAGGRGEGSSSALDELCAQACETVHADRATIWARRDRQLVAVNQYGYSGCSPPAPLAEAAAKLYTAALERERVIEATEARDDLRTASLYSSGAIHCDTRSVLAAAIRRAGELAGVIAFEWSGEPRAWFADELSFVCGVADQVAQALADSEREQALADLRALTGELMRLQDEERRRIGRDLHDSTGQTLAALEISLARLAGARTMPAEERRELLQQCVDLASQCSREIRTASYLLHPPLLDELGLLSALKWLADGLRERSGIEVRLEQPESMVRLTREEELTLFRVAQEALTNVHRHAASPWASIRLSVRPDSVLLEIRDAGRGIRSAHTGESAFTLGVGLAGMRERIRQVGGTFSVESAGTGTVVRVTLPVEHREHMEGAHA